MEKNVVGDRVLYLERLMGEKEEVVGVVVVMLLILILIDKSPCEEFQRG